MPPWRFLPLQEGCSSCGPKTAAAKTIEVNRRPYGALSDFREWVGDEVCL